jgi:hypothetical protein
MNIEEASHLPEVNFLKADSKADLNFNASSLSLIVASFKTSTGDFEETLTIKRALSSSGCGILYEAKTTDGSS